MCVGYLDPCGKGEHDWVEQPDSSFRYCKRKGCGVVQFKEDVETAEALKSYFQHCLRSLKWRRRAVGKTMKPLESAILDVEIEMLEKYLT